MATTPLSRVVLGVDPKRLALVLDWLEEETRTCGALYGFLINRAGQIVAADGPVDERTLTAIGLRLVPVFMVSRRLSRTFHEWPVRATVEDGGRSSRLVTQPLDDDWMVVLAFDTPPPPLVATLSQRWTERTAALAAPAVQTTSGPVAPATIVRDSIDLLFKDE